MGSTIVFLNSKGGSGKSTSVLECAYQLGAAGKSVLVVDMDPQGNSTMMLSANKDWAAAETNLYHLMTDKDIALSDGVRPASDAYPNCLLIPSSPRLATIESNLQNRANKEGIIKRLLAPIKPNVDVILIDLGPAVNFLALNALVAADSYIIPVDLSQYSQEGIAVIRELAQDVIDSESNPKLKFLGVFFTSFMKGGAKSVGTLEAQLKTQFKDLLLDVKVPHSVKVIESQMKMTPVGSLEPQSTVSLAYKALANKLLPARGKQK